MNKKNKCFFAILSGYIIIGISMFLAILRFPYDLSYVIGLGGIIAFTGLILTPNEEAKTKC